MGDHAVLLVMVAKDHKPGAHPPPDSIDAAVEYGVLEAPVGGKWGGKRYGRGGRGHDAPSINRRCGGSR